MAKLNKAVVDIQKRNAFDLSFINSLTGTVGTLVPCLCKKVIPGDIVSDKVAFQVELPPLASSFRGKIDFRMEAFFVPNRIVYGGWQDYMMYNGGLSDQYRPEGVDTCYLPYFNMTPGNQSNTLADYLGFTGFKGDGSQALTYPVSALPFLAYHKIYDDWYRDSSVQKPIFRPRSVTDSTLKGYHIPYIRITEDKPLNDLSWPTGTNFMTLYDGVAIGALRQRNYAKDMYTSAFTTVNGGTNPVEVATTGDSFTIAQFRAANALQRFAERNQLARGDYKRSIYVNYGVTPSDAVCNRSIYLGSCKAPIVTKDIYCTSESSAAATSSSTNPFTALVGGRGSNGSATLNGTLFKNFKVTEHGYIIVLCSLVPQAAYTNRIDETLGQVGKFSDSFVVPSLAQVGNQAIYQSSINGLSYESTGTFRAIFGYTERYAEYKTSVNEVHGNFRPGADLDFMVVARPITGPVEMSSNFLEIKKTDLDNITAVNAALSEYGFMADIYHDLKAIRPLPKYSIPTLCDHILDSKWVEIDKSYNL